MTVYLHIFVLVIFWRGNDNTKWAFVLRNLGMIIEHHREFVVIDNTGNCLSVHTSTVIISILGQITLNQQAFIKRLYSKQCARTRNIAHRGQYVLFLPFQMFICKAGTQTYKECNVMDVMTGAECGDRAEEERDWVGGRAFTEGRNAGRREQV